MPQQTLRQPHLHPCSMDLFSCKIISRRSTEKFATASANRIIEIFLETVSAAFHEKRLPSFLFYHLSKLNSLGLSKKCYYIHSFCLPLFQSICKRNKNWQNLQVVQKSIYTCIVSDSLSDIRFILNKISEKANTILSETPIQLQLKL